MISCVRCGCEIDGTSGIVVHPLDVPMARCHGCADQVRRDFIAWLRSYSVEQGMKRGEPGKALATLPPFGPVS